MKKNILMLIAVMAMVCTGVQAQQLKVVYVTTEAVPSATDEVYATLNRNFDVTVTTALDGSGEAYTNADVVFLSEYPGSGNVNTAYLKNSPKPMFFMKGHGAQNNRWAWADAAAVQPTDPALLSITIPNATGDLYKGLVAESGSTYKMLLAGFPDSKGLIALPQLKAAASVQSKAFIGSTGDSVVVAIFPAGTQADGAAALTSSYVYFGLTATSTQYMTPNAKQLIVNGVKILGGQTPTGEEEMTGGDGGYKLKLSGIGGAFTYSPALQPIYETGDTVRVTVTADIDSVFVRWSDGVTDNPRKFTFASDSIELSAEFACILPPIRTPLNVAYVTKAKATDSVLKVLRRNFTTVVNEVRTNGALTAGDATALEAYDVVVLSSNYDGGNMLVMKNFSKPVLVMHGGVMPEDNNYYTANDDARWGWVTSRAGHTESLVWEQLMVFQKSIEVQPADKTNDLYKGLMYIGNTARLLDTMAKAGDGGILVRHQGLITTANPKTGSLKAKVIPAVSNNDNSYAVYYQNAGNLADGTNALVSPYCYIGLSPQSYPFINANMKQLIINAVKVLGGLVPGGDEETAGLGAPVVTSISLQPSLNLRVPAMAKLSATMVGDKLADNVMRWSSSNPTVATVDQFGNVQAVNVGSANITATCADGTVSQTCAVTVAGISDVLLSENFRDWEKRTSKLILSNTDSTPNYPSGVNMNNEVIIPRPLKGSAAGGSVDFTLKNTSVLPFLGSKLLNMNPGVLTPTGSGNNNLTGTVTTSPNPPTDATQGEIGSITYSESGIIIGQVNHDVKFIELELSMFGEGRLVKLSKSYDGVNWVKVDAVQGGSEGRLDHIVTAAQIAEKYIINLPKAEKNFLLRVGPGKSANQAANVAQTQRFNLHSVKYYAPNGENIPVTSLALSVLEKPANASVVGSTITMVAPGSWCELSGVVKLGYTCTPADATNTNVVWTSSNSAVAEVDATGNLIPKTAGTTTITATAEGTAVTATYTVNVSASAAGSVVCPTSMSVVEDWTGENANPNGYLRVRANESYSLKTLIEPANSSYKNVVFSSTSEFIEIKDSVVIGVNKGWAMVYATLQTDNEGGSGFVDSIYVQIMPPAYVSGEPAPDSGAPVLPMLFNARTELSPTRRIGSDQLDEAWAHDTWFNFARTGLRREVTQDTGVYAETGINVLNYSRIQGTYLNAVEENEATADFANIGLKTTRAAGRQTRLIFAFEGKLDSLQVGIVVTGSAQPSTVAVQESNNGEQWNDVFYFVNATSATLENESADKVFEMAPTGRYHYPVVKGFDANSRFVRLFQTESGASSSVAHNIYIDRINLYGAPACDTCSDTPDVPSGVRKDKVDNHGINVYPNPTNGQLQLNGEKAIARVEVVNLQSGVIVKRVPQGGVTAATLQLDELVSGTYLVVIFVEGSSKPQVVKISKQ